MYHYHTFAPGFYAIIKETDKGAFVYRWHATKKKAKKHLRSLTQPKKEFPDYKD